jgi:HK97 family phage major capsid protein
MNRTSNLLAAGLVAATALSPVAAVPRGLVSFPRADGSNPAALFAQLNQAFEAFKSEHKADVEALRKDVVQAEKVDRINDQIGTLQAAIDELTAKAAAMSLGGTGAGGDGVSADERNYAKVFAGYFRGTVDKAEVEAAIKKGGIFAAMTVGTPADGGYTAPIEWDRTITDRLKIVSQMRAICQVLQIGVGAFKKLYNDRNTASGWVGEQGARNQTGNAQLAEHTFTVGEIYAKPVASQTILDDSLIDIAQWLANEVELEFSKQEGAAFINGDGTNKPRGVLQYTAGNSHPMGAIPTVISGDADKITEDGLIDLVYDLPSEFTGNARFVMNRKTQGKVRKIKDADGQYLWRPGLEAGQPATLLSFPVSEMPGMPDVAPNAIPIMFGDFRQGYLIVDRMGVRLLRDPYSAKPNVEFYTTKRVGGGVANPEALRYHKVAAPA